MIERLIQVKAEMILDGVIEGLMMKSESIEDGDD